MKLLTETEIRKFQNDYPFLTGIRFGDEKEDIWHDAIGIMHNQARLTTSIYDLGKIPQQSYRRLFLLAGQDWWRESNRTIPIQFFLRDRMDMFRGSLLHVSTAKTKVLFGPIISLDLIQPKRGKKKTHHMDIEEVPEVIIHRKRKSAN